MTYSIIVPIYNASLYLRRCINSILGQTFCDFELILVDDVSSDCSLDICNHYKEADRRVKVVHKENGGVTSARKAGIRIATYDYIVCVDSDDYVDVDFLKSVNDVLTPGVDVLCVGYVDQFGNENNNGIDCGDYMWSDFSKRFFIDTNRRLPNEGCVHYNLWTKVIKREMFIKHQPTIGDEIVMGEDLLLVTKVLMDARLIRVAPIFGYHYCVNENSATNSFNPNKLREYCILCDCLENFFPSKKISIFCFYRLIALFYSASRFYSTFDSFKDSFLENNYCRALINRIRLMPAHKRSVKYTILYLLLKLKCYKSIFSYFRKKNGK